MSEEKKPLEFPKEYGTINRVVHEEESWGGIWRGEHPEHGKVLFVCYTTAEGKAMLQESLPALERWQRLAHGTAPGLLRIFAINADAAVPHLVVQGTEGQTLFNRVLAGELDPKQRMRAIHSVAKTLSLAKTYEIPFVAIVPWSIIQVQDHDAPWQLIPIAPGAKQHARVIAGGKYEPPGLEGSALEELNADVYSLSLIGLEAVTSSFTSAASAEEKRDAVPYTRLRMILSNGLNLNKGAYDDPKMMQLALERWLKAEADEDMKEHQEKIAAAQRKPWQQKMYENRKPLIAGGAFLASTLLLIFVVICSVGAFKTRNTENTPYGMLNLYFEELIDGDVDDAKKYTVGEATAQTDRMMEDIRRMEEKHLASKFAEHVPRVAGDSNTRTAKIDLKGENGDLFMQAEVTIKVEPMGMWRIYNLYYKPLRSEDEEE